MSKLHVKLCEKHFAQAKDAIKDRGLLGLVSHHTQKEIDKVLLDLETSTDHKSDFDPLALLVWSVWRRAVNENGSAFFTCPLCYADENGRKGNEWIEGCANAQLNVARGLGLVRVQ